MIVAPPGSLKTELLKALEYERDSHLIDQITPNTFISGHIERPGAASKEPPGLLHRIGPSGVIVFSDFSTILGISVEKRATILADLRRIYDGSLRKEFGTAAAKKGHREWKGRITLLAAATPEVDRHFTVDQALGERFLKVRCSRANGTEAAIAAMTQDRTQAQKELQAAVHAVLGYSSQREPALSERLLSKVAALAEFVVRARTHVHRDGKEKKITYIPEAESPTRLAQQLAQLSKGSALVDRSMMVRQMDYEMVRRVGMDCIPAPRRKILEYLSTGDESNVAALPPVTRHYSEEELRLLGLITGSGESALLSSSALKLASTAELI